VEAPAISWRPLGRLFVEKGLLNEERLEHALDAQAETGGRLGEKLVELGYVTRSTLAHLLAEQYGVELAYETGFGTGLRAELERRHESTTRPAGEPHADDEPPFLTLVEPTPDPLQKNEALLSAFAGLEEQWARLAAAEARVAEVERELDVMRRRFDHHEMLSAAPAADEDTSASAKLRRARTTPRT
jgi:hypothetical protein